MKHIGYTLGIKREAYTRPGGLLVIPYLSLTWAMVDERKKSEEKMQGGNFNRRVSGNLK